MDTVPYTNKRRLNRRRFLSGVSVLGAASLLRLGQADAAEPPPEVKKIRLTHAPSICLAPQLLAEELLKFEGFSEVEYVEIKVNKQVSEVASGRVDMAQTATTEVIPAIDAVEPVVVIAGIHAGCFELFVDKRIGKITDLKGKKVVIGALGGAEHVYVSSIAAYVGMKPQTDIDWVVAHASADAMRLFAEGKADAFLAFPPEPQELRTKGIGRVIVNTTTDRPWSQYYCCSLVVNRDFMRKHPSATKRALRAMLKASDICAQEPERVARYLVSKSYASRYDVALEVMKSLPYRMWRESHPEDTIRFHALRLHEVGMIKSTPQKIIAQGTDWRFLNDLKRELKA